MVFTTRFKRAKSRLGREYDFFQSVAFATKTDSIGHFILRIIISDN